MKNRRRFSALDYRRHSTFQDIWNLPRPTLHSKINVFIQNVPFALLKE